MKMNYDFELEKGLDIPEDVEALMYVDTDTNTVVILDGYFGELLSEYTIH